VRALDQATHGRAQLVEIGGRQGVDRRVGDQQVAAGQEPGQGRCPPSTEEREHSPERQQAANQEGLWPELRHHGPRRDRRAGQEPCQERQRRRGPARDGERGEQKQRNRQQARERPEPLSAPDRVETQAREQREGERDQDEELHRRPEKAHQLREGRRQRTVAARADHHA
jgi:hypothetical protein